MISIRLKSHPQPTWCYLYKNQSGELKTTPSLSESDYKTQQMQPLSNSKKTGLLRMFKKLVKENRLYLQNHSKNDIIDYQP